MGPICRRITEAYAFEFVEIPDQLEGVISKRANRAGFILNGQHPLGDADILERIEEEMLTKVDWVQNVLEPEKVSLTPDDLLLTKADPPIADDAICIQLAEGIQLAAGIRIIHCNFEV